MPMASESRVREGAAVGTGKSVPSLRRGPFAALVCVCAGALGLCAGCHQAGSVAPSGSGEAVTATAPSIAFEFVDVAPEAGVNVVYQNGREAGHSSILESLGGGAAVVDVDRDGWYDLFVTTGGGFDAKRIFGLPARLFRNLGSWRFSDISQAAGEGFPSPHYTHGCFAGDYDNDGFPDLLVTGYGGLQLWHNQGDGTLVEVSREAGLQDTLWSSAAAWGDLDNDGWLDLYVAHYVDWSFSNHPRCVGPRPDLVDICPPKVFSPLPDTVWRNERDGTFSDQTAHWGLRPDGKGLGVVIGDINLDGFADIYVGNDTTDNFLYINELNGPSGKLRECAVLSGVAVDDRGTPNGSMGVDLGDYNLDGRPDIWVANFEVESFALYRNDGNGQFLHVSRATGVTALGGLFVGFGTAFVDLDRDGDEDILINNGHVINYPRNAPFLQQPVLLVNEQGQRYLRYEFPAGTYFATPHAGRGLAMGDLDEDGDVDVVMTNNHERLAVLRNDTPAPARYLRVRLIGRRSNRNAIGAHVFLLTRQGKRILRLVKSGVSYLSDHDERLDWGIPAGDEPEELHIRWPAGETSIISITPQTRTLTVWEPLQ
ncbi:MAG: hypothetical protein KatS3mg110_3530 [Pirellulaceae bacterium]|nr:MAG: hypothetical protein KatS3mg110_3530 [Pirellulaceae bacterium]